MVSKLFSGIQLKKGSCIIAALSSMFLAFGMYHVHSFAGVTEGGVLGFTLLLENWVGISPAVSGFVMNMLCYIMGWRLLGKEFVVYSMISAVGFSAAYRVCEQFPPLWPGLVQMPLLAAVLGAVFVGLGAGFCVRIGGATGGDDALAMSISYLTKCKIERVYRIADFVVLALSVSYIPLNRIGYSVLTVLLSGQLIGVIQRMKMPKISLFDRKNREDCYDGEV